MASFNLVQLRYFLSVADLGSFAAAAERENVSATAIASAVTQLERSLDTRLCVRRRALGVELTRAGRLLAAEAARLLSSADEIERTVAGAGRDLVGPLVVGCYGNFAPTLLPGLIEGFSALHPRVDVNFRIASQDVLQDLLLDGQIDLALVYDIDLRPGMMKKELYRSRVHLIVSAEHRFAERGSVTLSEMREDPYILFESPPAGDHALAIFEAHDITPRIRFRSEQFELTRALVARNLGYCMMVYRSRSHVSHEGLRLVELEITPEIDPESTILVWPRSMVLSTRAHAFADFAHAYITDQLRHAPWVLPFPT